MDIQVYKFGGASVASAEQFRNVAEIVTHAGIPALCVVVSALGKTTNELERVIESFTNNDFKQARLLLNNLREEHVKIVRELQLGKQTSDRIDHLFLSADAKIEEYSQLHYDEAYDQFICLGEICSSHILTDLIQKLSGKSEWVDARRIIQTNEVFRDATVNWSSTQERVNSTLLPILRTGTVVVTQGFIGGHNGRTTTLGREGSDYTAAILSYCMDVSSMTIWKDVPGILTGDPNEFEDVLKLDRLSYREAIEMTYYGAKVIHPKTIKPLQNKGIKLYVKPYGAPHQEGTLISVDRATSYPPIVVVEKNQCLLHISTNDFSFVAEHHMSRIFQLIAKHRIKVNMIRNTAISFTVCVTEPRRRLEDLIKELEEDFTVIADKNLELITIRHFEKSQIDEILGRRTIVFEERIKDTLQMVVRRVPEMKRKQPST